MTEFILASSSPRRKELLEQLGLNFEIIPSDIDEVLKGNTPGDMVKGLALEKATSVSKKVPEGKIIIGADTIVCIDGIIMGKPADEDDAYIMLKRLSGRVHEVYTGLALINTFKGEILNDYECTEVFINELTDEEIENYIKLREPMDKAGAYAIQGKGSLIVKRIKGCYYNVVGLPLGKLREMLLKWDIDLLKIGV
ncbi:MAG: Maf family protein [Thermoanaerobacteraceae bacterium]|nr:Maf family protein [Thermoanaerobacteraceae bacterium]